MCCWDCWSINYSDRRRQFRLIMQKMPNKVFNVVNLTTSSAFLWRRATAEGEKRVRMPKGRRGELCPPSCFPLNGTTITTGATKRQRREKLNKDPTAQWARSYSFAIKAKIIMLIRENINKVFNMSKVGSI